MPAIGILISFRRWGNYIGFCMDKIAIVVIEGHSDFRKELYLLLQNIKDFECAGQFSSIEQALKKFPKADVVLLDIDLPRMSGILGIPRIRHVAPEAKIVLLTGNENTDTILQVIRAGANGYLLKKTPPAQLIESIKDSLQGGMPIAPVIVAKIINIFKEYLNKPLSNASSLTPRECQILSLLVEGFSYKMIAEHCVISIDTVRNHIRNIYRKLKVSSKSQAVSKALREGII